MVRMIMRLISVVQGLPPSVSDKSNAACMGVPCNLRTPSVSTSIFITSNQNPLSGLSPLMKFSTASPDFVNAFQTHDTSYVRDNSSNYHEPSQLPAMHDAMNQTRSERSKKTGRGGIFTQVTGKYSAGLSRGFHRSQLNNLPSFLTVTPSHWRLSTMQTEPVGKKPVDR